MDEIKTKKKHRLIKKNTKGGKKYYYSKYCFVRRSIIKPPSLLIFLFLISLLGYNK